MNERLPFRVEAMALSDLDQVMEIEKVSFTAPWSARAYRFEITQNTSSTMLVVHPEPCASNLLRRLTTRHEATPVLGYGGFWLLVDEAHISTIAVDPTYRGLGLGELLMLSLLARGTELHARRSTLEVRISNLTAQSLYHKCGFQIVAMNKRYYADNNEDAYIMATPPLDTPEFQASILQLRTELAARHRKLAADEPQIGIKRSGG